MALYASIPMMVSMTKTIDSLVDLVTMPLYPDEPQCSGKCWSFLAERCRRLGGCQEEWTGWTFLDYKYQQAVMNSSDYYLPL